MSIEQTSKIDWSTSFGQLALGIWGIATYLALLAGVAWLAVLCGGSNPKWVAFVAVLNTTSVHWMLFSSIQRRSNK